jgi:DNA-formamidopyrimidine glycosylase
MPEGPEVHSQADGLRLLLQGQVVTRIRFRKGWTLRKTLDDDVSDLLTNLPLTIEDIWAHGKKIVIKFADHYYMVVFLGMEGRWSAIPLNHSHIYIQTQSGDRVWYDDKRYLGNFEFYHSRRELRSRLAKVGPDLITDDIHVDDWLAVTTSPRLANKQICEFLMDQKYFSGVGNYIKAEVLYKARIRPDALLHQLNTKLLSKLFVIIRKLIRESYSAQGASLHSYINVDGNKGDFRVIVYDHSEDPDGEKVITSIFKDSRTTHWVPTVQILPSVWKGYRGISRRRLEASKGSGGYAVWELRSYCHQAGLSVEGTKSVLVRRLFKHQYE